MFVAILTCFVVDSLLALGVDIIFGVVAAVVVVVLVVVVVVVVVVVCVCVLLLFVRVLLFWLLFLPWV